MKVGATCRKQTRMCLTGCKRLLRHLSPLQGIATCVLLLRAALRCCCARSLVKCSSIAARYLPDKLFGAAAVHPLLITLKQGVNMLQGRAVYFTVLLHSNGIACAATSVACTSWTLFAC